MQDHLKETRSFPWLICLVFVVVCLVMLTAYKVDQNSQRMARMNQRYLDAQTVNALLMEHRNRMQTAFRARITIEEFEDTFGSIKRLPPGTRMTHSYTHQPSHCVYELRFVEGRLQGFNYEQDHAVAFPGIVIDSPAYLRTEAVRISVLNVSFWTWWLVLMIGIMLQNYRRKLALPLVVLSLSCGLCWYLSPGYNPSWNGIFSNDNLAFFLMMLFASFTYCSLLYQQDENDSFEPRNTLFT